jgi:hypothetical protein
MAIIITKFIVASSIVAVAGGGAGVVAYQAYSSEQHPAVENTTGTAAQPAAGFDWSMQWYDTQKAIRDSETGSAAVASY